MVHSIITFCYPAFNDTQENVYVFDEGGSDEHLTHFSLETSRKVFG